MIGLTLALASGGVAAIAAGNLAPILQKYRRVRALRRCCTAARVLALTYDDGPGPLLTTALLECLATRKASATFFPTGRSARANPDLLDQIAARGHEIGCHSDVHLHAWRSTPWNLATDVDCGFDSLQRWVPADGWYRPPYGKITLPVWFAVQRRMARLAWWTADSGDTHAVLPDPLSVVERVRRDGGGVVLMHDFDRDPSTREQRHRFVLTTTELMLDLARSDGLQVLTLDQLRQQIENDHARRA